jgi:hypothetical protein
MKEIKEINLVSLVASHEKDQDGQAITSRHRVGVAMVHFSETDNRFVLNIMSSIHQVNFGGMYYEPTQSEWDHLLRTKSVFASPNNRGIPTMIDYR